MRQFAASLVFALILAGCGGAAPQHKPAEAPAEEHQKEDEHHHHHHEPSRGGTLVELGDHVGNIEFVLDSATGTLSAYCTDAHAENPVRLKSDALVLSIVTSAAAAPIELRLAATANPLTGESVGDTSQFEAQHDALKGLSTFKATLAPLSYRGVQVDATEFGYTANAVK